MEAKGLQMVLYKSFCNHFKFFLETEIIKGLVKKYGGGGVGRSREGVGHQFLSPY